MTIWSMVGRRSLGMISSVMVGAYGRDVIGEEARRRRLIRVPFAVGRGAPLWMRRSPLRGNVR